MKTVIALVAFAASLLAAPAARAQDDKEELKRRILEQIEKKLREEEKRILEEISKLIDEELAKARGRKPAEPGPAAPAAGKSPFLGVKPEAEQPEEEDFKLWKIEGGVGVEIVPGSPAEKAGLQDGDVIFEADGKKVREWSELPSAVGAKKVGDQVKLKFIRGKESKELTVTLGERPPDMPGAPAPPPAPPKAETPKEPPSRQGRLGVSPGAATGKGMAIELVSPGSPAEKAGLKAGDVLAKLDTTAIWKEDDLAAFMKSTKPGQKVEVTALRDGAEKKFSVTLGEP